MSEENLDVEPRPRSLLRQVGQTLGVLHRSRHALDSSNDNAPAATFLQRKRASMDSVSTQDLQSKYTSKKTAASARSTTPISFLNQVKSHWNKTKKSSATSQLKSDDDDYTHLSLPLGPFGSVSSFVSLLLLLHADGSHLHAGGKRIIADMGIRERDLRHRCFSK